MTDHPLLAELARFGVRLGLDRTRSLLAFMGSPHLAVPVIHIGGTNGKGSVTRMVSAALTAAGHRVGEYTSPHLQRINERLRVDGVEISDADLDGLLDDVDRARRAWAGASGQTSDSGVDPDRSLTYFEMMTTAAFLHFARQSLDVAVLEVGLGGRLDATNVVEAPLATSIVTVGIDHTAQLGPDLAGIASEKAGIVKPGRPVIVGPLAPPAMRVVRATALDRGAPLLAPGAGYRIARNRDGTLNWSLQGNEDRSLRELSLSLAGAHQLDNAGVAITILSQLPPELAVPEAILRTALSTVSHPGRLEWLEPDRLLVDCAHNPDGSAQLAAYLSDLPRKRRRTLLLGASDDKDVRSMVIALTRSVDRVFTTQCRHPRAAEAGALAALLVGVDLPVLPAGPIEQALPLARRGDDLVIVAGSVFLAGAVRELVGAR